MSAVAKGMAVLTLGIAAVSYGLGHAQASRPEKVEVPVYKTEIRTETETVEVVKTEPLPESCKTLPLYAAKVAEGNGVLDTAVGDIQLALLELGRAAYMRDIPKINEVTEVINRNRRIIDENVVDRAQATVNLTTQLELCELGIE